MKSDSIILIKSYAFAVKVVKLCQSLVQNKKEYVLSKQLMRSGTSIGANVEEATGGQSRRDFYAKLTISYKEARESHYRIRLLFDTGYIDKEQKEELINDIEEILKIIGSIQKTMKQNEG